jgi:hypothetical protein
VEEGVDVLSLSLGDDEAGDFAYDPIALGGYTAIMEGVFVSAAGGNNGPEPATVANEAPWLLTNAAATTDRRFVATVKLVNWLQLDGESLFQPKKFLSVQRPLVLGMKDGSCSDQTILTPEFIGGKTVLCEGGGKLSSLKMGAILFNGGAAGMIVTTIKMFGSVIQPKAHIFPASQVDYAVGQKIKAYMNSTDNPTAELVFKGAVLGNRRAPMVAPFSSRGPSKQNQGILKPDITGPGVNIIAGVAEPAGLMTPPNALAAKFDIMSGTSMSTPHISGIGAVIKKAHPTWSPAAIKSALMTTADTLNRGRMPIADQSGYPAQPARAGHRLHQPDEVAQSRACLQPDGDGLHSVPVRARLQRSRNQLHHPPVAAHVVQAPAGRRTEGPQLPVHHGVPGPGALRREREPRRDECRARQGRVRRQGRGAEHAVGDGDAGRAQVQEGEPGEAVHGHHQERGWKKGERGDRRGAAQVDLGQERRAQPDPRVMAEVRQGH